MGTEVLAVPRRLVVDANVVIAAFLRDSTVRRLFSLAFLDLMAPESHLDEVSKYLPELARRAKLSRSAAEEVLAQIESFIVTIPETSTLSEWERAAVAMADIDPDDVPYLAAALAVPCDGIWSDDPDLKKQGIVPCWTTRELVAALKEEGVDV